MIMPIFLNLGKFALLEMVDKQTANLFVCNFHLDKITRVLYNSFVFTIYMLKMNLDRLMVLYTSEQILIKVL